MKIRSFNVMPNLPENLKALDELSKNMWFTWNHDAIKLFMEIDTDLWIKSHRNPKWLLGNINMKRLTELSRDEKFLQKLSAVYENYKNYLESPTWFDGAKKDLGDNFKPAYFSMEFGIGEGLPMYSGGLGMLAGDHLKSASDLGLPLVGVGLFYQKGYIQQVLTRENWQTEFYPENDWINMPVKKVKRADGADLIISVEMGAEQVKAAVWEVSVGRIPLYLLDTNIQENSPQHRLITEKLYGGDRDTRIRQEIVLGVGGVRALSAMGIYPTVYHINEGHSAFLLLERIKQLMTAKKLSFSEAKTAVWTSSVFTTHTPVVAGNEHFEPELVRRYLEPMASSLKLSWEEFLNLGKETEDAKTFCMTVLALKLCAFLNGVSQLHGEVSRQMWRDIWKEIPFSEIPIKSVTNGVHTMSWISHEHAELYKKHLEAKKEEVCDTVQNYNWDNADKISDEELWRAHTIRKNKMIEVVRQRELRRLERLTSDITAVNDVRNILNPDVFTIGFARRFASYKRAGLLFSNPDRLSQIINNSRFPIQLVFAGKAHQQDNEGKKILKHIAELAQDPRFKGKLIFVEDYNMNIARYLVQGVDLWLNNPVRPMEASGTSGMKCAINGILNFSILDGWWVEAYKPELGWAPGLSADYISPQERDFAESSAMYNIIEKDIAPLFYDRNDKGIPVKWLKKVKASIKTIVPQFSTSRMVRDYCDMFYFNAHRLFIAMMEGENAKNTSVWRNKLRANWHKIKIEDISTGQKETLRAGDKLKITARVYLDGLSSRDVSVEAFMGKIGTDAGLVNGNIHRMSKVSGESGTYIFDTEIEITESGRHDYSLRVVPARSDLPYPFTPPLITWER